MEVNEKLHINDFEDIVRDMFLNTTRSEYNSHSQLLHLLLQQEIHAIRDSRSAAMITIHPPTTTSFSSSTIIILYVKYNIRDLCDILRFLCSVHEHYFQNGLKIEEVHREM